MAPWLAEQRVSCFHGAGSGRSAPLLALLIPLGGGIREPSATTSYLFRSCSIASWGKSVQCHLLMQSRKVESKIRSLAGSPEAAEDGVCIFSVDVWLE